jgi:hypothetical protein
LKVLPARAIPVVPEDRVARAVPEAARVELVVPEGQAVPVVPEGPAVRVDPVVVLVQAARVAAGVAQEVPGAPEEDRMDPAGTSDPAASDDSLRSVLFKIERIP